MIIAFYIVAALLVLACAAYLMLSVKRKPALQRVVEHKQANLAILREQLSGSKSEAELEEVGTVLQIGDGVARIYGLSKVQAGELLVEHGADVNAVDGNQSTALMHATTHEHSEVERVLRRGGAAD